MLAAVRVCLQKTVGQCTLKTTAIVQRIDVAVWLVFVRPSLPSVNNLLDCVQRRQIESLVCVCVCNMYSKSNHQQCFDESAHCLCNSVQISSLRSHSRT